LSVRSDVKCQRRGGAARLLHLAARMIEQPPEPDVPKPPDVVNSPIDVNRPVPPGKPHGDDRPDIHPTPPPTDPARPVV
jgi:hypothetical protein